MLSGDCVGCIYQHACAIRFNSVKKGEFVYCPDGTRHLVDDAAIHVKAESAVF